MNRIMKKLIMTLIFVSVIITDGFAFCGRKIETVHAEISAYNEDERLYNAKSIDIENDFRAIVAPDGSLYTWFDGEYELGGDASLALGNGGRPVSTPTRILGNVSRVSLSINGGGAITQNGDLYWWGGSERMSCNLSPTHGGYYFRNTDLDGNIIFNEWVPGYNDVVGYNYSWNPVYVMGNVLDYDSDGHMALTEDGNLYNIYDMYENRQKVEKEADENFPKKIGAITNEDTYFNELQMSKRKNYYAEKQSWGKELVLSNVKMFRYIDIGGLYDYYGSYEGDDGYNKAWFAVTNDGKLYYKPRKSSKTILVMENVKDVTLVSETSHLFATLKVNGELYLWKDEEFQYQGELTTPIKVLENIKAIFPAESAKIRSTDGGGVAITDKNELYAITDDNYNDGYTRNIHKIKNNLNVLNYVVEYPFLTAITVEGEVYVYDLYDVVNDKIGTTSEYKVDTVKLMDNVIMCSSYNRVYYAITKDGKVYMWSLYNYSNMESITPTLFMDLNNNNMYQNINGIDGDFGLSMQDEIDVAVGESISINPEIYSINSDNLERISNGVVWATSNAAVASVKGCTSFQADSIPSTYSSPGLQDYSLWWSHGLAQIYGKKEGKVLITATLVDGTSRSCTVNVVKGMDNSKEVGSQGHSVTIGDDQSGSTGNDSEVSKFYPGDWSLKSQCYPIELSQKDNEDGTYTIKASIGIGRSNILDDKTEWDRYKKICDDAASDLSKVNELELERKYNLQKFSIIDENATMSELKKPSLAIMGYIENKYDKNGNLITGTGRIAGDLKWTGTINWRFTTPIGPVYIKMGYSGTVSLNLGPQWDDKEKKMSCEGAITLTPAISITGGYGIEKVASVSATGNAEIPMTVETSAKKSEENSKKIKVEAKSSGKIKASASVNAHVIFVFDKTWTLAEYKQTLWDTTTNSSNISQETLKVMEAPSEGENAEWKGEVLDENAYNQFDLKQGILDSSVPILIKYNGKQVLVWQDYDSSRVTANSSVLKYSVLKDGNWSEPKAVYDDGCGDAFADLKIIDGKLVLVWQKHTTIITDSDTEDINGALELLASSSEIYYAEFDDFGNEFTNITKVTDNDTCDMMPHFVEGTKDVLITYVRNDASSFLQTEGTNEIYCAQKTEEGFSEEECIERAQGTVDRYVTFKDGNDTVVMYVTQVDDIVSIANNMGKHGDELNKIIRFSDEGTISALDYVDGNIRFILDGELYQYNYLADRITQFNAGSGYFDDTAIYFSNGDKSGYIWSIYDEEEKTGSLIASMETDNGFSDPVKLCSFDGAVSRIVAPVLNDDGDWNIILNQENIEDQSHDLIYVQKKEEIVTSLVTAYIDEFDRQNDLTGVYYVFENKSDIAIEDLVMEITSEDGHSIKESITRHVEPGETVSGTQYIDLSEIDKGQKVNINLYEQGQENGTYEGVSDELALTDISIVGMAEEREEGIVITANIENMGEEDADMIVELYGDADCTTMIDDSDAIGVKPGETAATEFVISPDDIVYDNGAAYLTLVSVVNNGDYDESNNKTYLVLYEGEKVYADTHVKADEDDNEPIDGDRENNDDNSGDSENVNNDPVSETGGSSESQVNAPGGLTNSKGNVSESSSSQSSSDNTIIQGNVESNSDTAVAVSVGQILVDNKLKICVQVISNDPANSRVTFVKSTDTKKNKKTIMKIPDKVEIDGVSYKVVAISDNALKNLKKLKKVVIGKNVTSIGKNTFNGCKNLKTITIKSTGLKFVGKNAINGINKKAVIKVPKKQLKVYKKLFTKKTGYKKTMKIKK